MVDGPLFLSFSHQGRRDPSPHLYGECRTLFCPSPELGCLSYPTAVVEERMDTKQLTDALDGIFHKEGCRIVFWHDPEREFLDFIDANASLQLGDASVQVVRLDHTSSLAVKIRLEREDPTGRYLLYAPTEEPDYEDDWLLDMRLYSRSFRADRASIILDELGLGNQQLLRQHLADRRKFFDNKDRLQKLKPLVTTADTEMDLDRKMIAVVVKAEQPELFTILRTLFHAYTDNGDEIDLDTPPVSWSPLEKFDLALSFWQMIATAFGYSEDDPSLKKLLIRLLVTDYAHQLKPAAPVALQHLVLPSLGRANAVVCLAQWRDSNSKGSSYDRLSAQVAALINVDDHLHGLEVDDLLDVLTFQNVEHLIASSLHERVQHTADTINAEEVRAIVTRRQAGHWASLTVPGAPEVPRTALHAVYDALIAAADFFALRNQHLSGFDFPNALAMYRAYETTLYQFDQLYRHFHEAADQAEAQGWSILKPLRDSLEAAYTNWYMPQLALVWGKFVEPTGSTALLNTWRLETVSNQYDFYRKQVQSRLDEAENRKVYVVISDAFRYEAAQELTQTLNGMYRFKATLSSQLGVLPSYTPLGMASLLPHDTLTYKENGDILVDGKPSASIDQRHSIVQSRNGLACWASDLMAKKKDEGRAFVEGKRVVYVYHDTVDATGETDEDKTFAGVRTAINELAGLVSYIINTLNGNHVVITADHGFLFSESAPGEPEKSRLAEKPEGTVLVKKRYLIGYQLPEHEAAWRGQTSVTACATGAMEFWIPKAANRFHFVGGARFIHGGAMLQEIVVPVITVKHKKDKTTRGETRIKPVTVQVLGNTHRVTTNRHRFELIQMEPVSERVKPVTFKVAVYEGEEPITNMETVTFDSASGSMDERKKSLVLVLQDRQYDKKTPYRLVLGDVETGIEQQSAPVIIDRAFRDDF